MGLTMFMCNLIIQPSGNPFVYALKHNVCGDGWGGVDSWTLPTACTNLQVAATYLLRGHMEHEVHWGSTVYRLGHPSAAMFGPHCVTLSREAI